MKIINVKETRKELVKRRNEINDIRNNLSLNLNELQRQADSVRRKIDELDAENNDINREITFIDKVVKLEIKTEPEDVIVEEYDPDDIIYLDEENENKEGTDIDE